MTIKAWFDVEYTDAALDKARADAERSGGAVPPRKLPFLSSITPRFRFRFLAGPGGFIAKLPDGRRPHQFPAHLHLILDTSLTHFHLS